jgi:hypothetical protein
MATKTANKNASGRNWALIKPKIRFTTSCKFILAARQCALLLAWQGVAPYSTKLMYLPQYYICLKIKPGNKELPGVLVFAGKPNAAKAPGSSSFRPVPWTYLAAC